MCRNIRVLYNFNPPATEDEVKAASIQFVRKISGFTRPSKSNEAAFDQAVSQITRIASDLMKSLETSAPPKDRATEVLKAKARSAKRFGKPPALAHTQ